MEQFQKGCTLWNRSREQEREFQLQVAQFAIRLSELRSIKETLFSDTDFAFSVRKNDVIGNDTTEDLTLIPALEGSNCDSDLGDLSFKSLTRSMSSKPSEKNMDMLKESLLNSAFAFDKKLKSIEAVIELLQNS